MVHSLLRVRDLSSRLPEMFDTSPKEGESDQEKRDEIVTNRGGADVDEQRSVP